MEIKNKTQFEAATKQESTFIELEEGRNVVRLVSPFFGVKEHKVSVNGNWRFIACPIATEQWSAQDEGREADKEMRCPICEKGKPEDKKIRVAFLAKALNRKNNKVGILKKGSTVFSPLFALKEEGFDLTKRDIVISRKGKDLDTEYTVSPTPSDSELNEVEKELILANDINLGQMTTPRSYDEIVDVLNGKDNKYKQS